MTDIPPNGAVAVNLKVFDGSTNIIREQTLNIPCDSVSQAKEIESACLEAVGDVAKHYGKEAVLVQTPGKPSTIHGEEG